MSKKIKAKVKADVSNTKLDFGVKAALPVAVKILGNVQVQSTKDTFDFVIKGQKGRQTSSFLINDRERVFAVGSTQKLCLSDTKLPATIKEVFSNVFTKHQNHKALTLSAKSGYGMPQMGFTRKTDAWRGFVSFTDGQLCMHTFDAYGVTMPKLQDIRAKHGLSVYRQGKNWVTVSYPKDKVKNLTAFCNEILSLV